MAVVRQSILVDVPRPFAYAHWLAPARYPDFMRDVAEIRASENYWRWEFRDPKDEPFTASLNVAKEEWAIRWETSEGPWRALDVTFGQLAGPSTWIVCSAEIEIPPAGAAVSSLESVVRRTRRWLADFQTMVEERWLAGDRQDAALGPDSLGCPQPERSG